MKIEEVNELVKEYYLEYVDRRRLIKQCEDFMVKYTLIISKNKVRHGDYSAYELVYDVFNDCLDKYDYSYNSKFTTFFISRLKFASIQYFNKRKYSFGVSDAKIREFVKLSKIPQDCLNKEQRNKLELLRQEVCINNSSYEDELFIPEFDMFNIENNELITMIKNFLYEDELNLLELSLVDGKSFIDISNILNVNEKTVRRRYQRIMYKLRKFIFNNKLY